MWPSFGGLNHPLDGESGSNRPTTPKMRPTTQLRCLELLAIQPQLWRNCRDLPTESAKLQRETIPSRKGQSREDRFAAQPRVRIQDLFDTLPGPEFPEDQFDRNPRSGNDRLPQHHGRVRCNQRHVQEAPPIRSPNSRQSINGPLYPVVQRFGKSISTGQLLPLPVRQFPVSTQSDLLRLAERSRSLAGPAARNAVTRETVMAARSSATPLFGLCYAAGCPNS